VSAFAGFRLLLQKEMREQLRTLRLVVVVAVLAAFGATSPLLAKLLPDIIKAAGTETAGLTITMPTPTTADAVTQLVKNLGQFGLLIAILVCMGTVATEKERGTAGFVLTKPVGRGPFITAKAAAIGLLLGAGIAAGYALAWIYTAVLFEALPLPGFTASGLLLWLSLLVTASVTFLFSVLARSSLVAGGAGFVALIVTGIVAAIPGIGAYAPPGLSTPAIALALGEPVGDLAGPIILNLALVGVALAAAQVAFRRQEL
jgi:ABC-2 type transport system permease protein